MTFYVENINTMEERSFNSLKKACAYAYDNKAKMCFGRVDNTMLVHNGYHNFDYAEMHESKEELYKACMAQCKAL